MSLKAPPVSPEASEQARQAPVAPRIEHREVRHGETVVDDYYWLREKSNPEVVKYLEAENAYTAAVTKDLDPFVSKLYDEMLARIKQTDLSVPVRRGEYLYYSRTEEGKQYPIQCRRKGSMDAPEQILLDENELSLGHKFVGLGAFAVSDDQNLLAYTIDFSGFRQYELQVKDLRTGRLLPDTAERVTSVEWAADNKTLFYTTEDAITKRPDTLFRHVLGGGSRDLLYYEEDETYDIHLYKSRDRKFLFLNIESKDTTECLYLRSGDTGKFAVLLPRRSKHRYYGDHREDLFYIRTNKNSLDFEVMTAPVSDPAESNWKTFIPPREGTLLEDIDLFRGFAVSVEKSQALNHLRVYNFEAHSWNEIMFPEPIYSAAPGSTPDFEATHYRYTYQSFITPPSVFDYDTQTGQSQLLKRQEVLGGYDPAEYVSERLWVSARDGARVPVSIVYNSRAFKRDGEHALFLYAYGSYGIGMPVTFSSSRLSLLNRGVAYAIAHIRGGDEMGEQWRQDGMLMKKKNTFFDFIDCAQYLVDHQWTSPGRLLIEGGSAGGMLMGVVVNMRPDLFRAVHAAVPFVDVMNTMMDPSLPLTVQEYLEWGNPNEKAAYDYMKSYSPYDNLAERAYPAMLVTTSFNDSQVMFWEPAKYVARLRALKTDRNPLLFKIKMEPAGHGGASGRYDRLKDTAFEYAWLLSQVGITT